MADQVQPEDELSLLRQITEVLRDTNIRADVHRLPFSHSKSKRYPQAIELAEQAHRHQIIGSGSDAWHIVTFTPEQIDLMAAFWKLARGLPRLRIRGVDILSLILYCRFPWQSHPDSSEKEQRIQVIAERLCSVKSQTLAGVARDLERNVYEPLCHEVTKLATVLENHGYLSYWDAASQTTKQQYRTPEEPLSRFRVIRELVAAGEYVQAVNEYYASLGSRSYGELHGELIYLKRLANMPLVGRDLLFFRPESSRSPLVKEHLVEYVACVDSVLEQRSEAGLESPLDLILANAPTMDELIQKKKDLWYKGAHIRGTEHETPNTPENSPVTLRSFNVIDDKCPEGRIFDKYPDQVQHCNLVELARPSVYAAPWTSTPSSYIEREIKGRGLHVASSVGYTLSTWASTKRTPDFTTIDSLDYLVEGKYATRDVRYTGRRHVIEQTEFFEFQLQRFSGHDYNPLLEVIEEILREAENELRERHNLPRIGEGWISELQLFGLVKNVFPEAVLHASPDWLRPQHLDVFVEGTRLAFEYQGRQHFEPVEFFGGQDAFEKTRKRDRRKARRCALNGVRLVQWRFDEPMSAEELEERLRKLGIDPD